MNKWTIGYGQELRLTIRLLLRRPAHALLVIFTLAIGIGLNSAMFSLVNAVLLRPLPAENPDRLVRIYGINREQNRQSISYPDYLDFQEATNVFSGLAATHLLAGALEITGGSQQTLSEAVSTNYFDVLGIQATVGRVFSGSDRFTDNMAVISYDLWKSQFASDANIIGKTVGLNRKAFTIIGVAPKSFHGTFVGVFPDLWVPLLQTHSWLGPDWQSNRNVLRIHLIGRLQSAVNTDQARAALQSIAEHLQKKYPDTNRRRGVGVEKATLLAGSLRPMVTVFLSLFLVIVGLVFLTACANLANLVFIQALARKREFSVRLALGAGRVHLVRKAFTESMLISIAGGIVGTVLASWCSNLFLRFNPIPSVPLRFDLALDYRVYFFTVFASMISAFILSLPVISLLRNTNPADNLKQEAASLSSGRIKAGLRKVFVSVQVAVSLMLLIGAGLFLQSLRNAQSIDLGFQPENALAVDLDLRTQGFTEKEGRRYYEQLIRRIGSLPGVVSASLSDLAPLDLATRRARVMIGNAEDPISSSVNRIAPDYFRTVRTNLLSGRDFDLNDRSNHQPVAIINEQMARAFWPQQNPIGQTFQVIGDEKTQMPAVVRIVGVAQNVTYRSIGESPQPHFYLPLLQDYDSAMTLLARTRSDAAPMIDIVQREIQNLNPSVQGFFPRTLIQHVGFSLLPAKMAAALSTVFGCLALALAAIGIYGVISYSVAQRLREIGVRMALGASPREVLQLFVREGFGWTIWGLLVGCASAYVVLRLASNFLYGISATDPATFFFGVLAILFLVFSATYFPAHRAARTDPMIALRYE